MNKYKSANISFVSKTTPARWRSEVASIHNETQCSSPSSIPKYNGHRQPPSLINAWTSNSRNQQEIPISIISSKDIDLPSNDRSKNSKTKHANNKCKWPKVLKLVLVMTIITLTLAAIVISIYGVVAAKTTTTTTMTTTTTTTSTSTSTTSTTTTTTTVTTLPSQCYSYTFISDVTRLATAPGGVASDTSIFSSSYTWYRFYGAGGTQIVTSAPSYYYCGTIYSGWYTGSMPPYGNTLSGTVCYVYLTSICLYSNTILVTNCDSYYVYGLIDPPLAYARYCTV